MCTTSCQQRRHRVEAGRCKVPLKPCCAHRWQTPTPEALSTKPNAVIGFNGMVNIVDSSRADKARKAESIMSYLWKICLCKDWKGAIEMCSRSLSDPLDLVERMLRITQARLTTSVPTRRSILESCVIMTWSAELFSNADWVKKRSS